jgi:hypothetical protein
MSDENGDTAVQQGEEAADTIIQTSRDTARQTAERFGEQAREGVRLANEASETGTQAMMRTGSSLAEAVQDMTNAWTQYAEEVMRQTSEASRALIGCRSLTEMLEVQLRFMRGNLQAFLDQSSKLAEIAGRMAKRPFEALQQAGSSGPQR